VSHAITTGVLRERLGFAGTIVTDALEMRALADTIGVERGYVAALAAGADAIETGALDYPHLVAAIPQAVQRALDDGTLTTERLRVASERTSNLVGLSALNPPVAGDSQDNSEEWSRYIEVLGDLPALHRPLVIEARPPAGMASGELPWSLAAPLAKLIPGTEVVRATGPLDVPPSGDLVVVVRDPQRYDWQRALLDLPAAVVVDVGWPATLPGDVPVVRTRGVAPFLLAAAADLLAGGRLQS
jgi:beta-N-acetylhexosaminidase